MNTVLSIDFDFWAEHDDAKHDWGHSESKFFIDLAWHLRASQMLRGTTPSREVFLPADEPRPGRFREYLFGRGWRFGVANLWVVDSHAQIARILTRKRKPVRVINVDAHCDLGYSNDPGRWVACDNWGEYYIEAGAIAEFQQVYPKWRQRRVPDWRGDFLKKAIRWDRHLGAKVTVTHGAESIPENVRPSDVFICRSGAWSPPWLDGHFVTLARSFTTGPLYSDWRDAPDFRSAIRHTDWRVARLGARVQSDAFAKMLGLSVGVVSSRELQRGLLGYRHEGEDVLAALAEG